MIDTIKIYAEISQDIYDVIRSKSIVKSAIDFSNGSILYDITNDSLIGSYDTRLSVRVNCGSKYRFASKSGGYIVEIEGSYHKWTTGFNSHNGFYDLQFICDSFIKHVSIVYNVDLPDISLWYLSRCDIAICYDLNNNNNVKSYINSLSRCNYPRRKMKFYSDESLYLSGCSTTLKIYNKLLEFRKHDLKRFTGTDFNINEYLKIIDGFVRFECEVKKPKLLKYYNKENSNFKHINVIDVKYDDLKCIWSEEFMKLLKFIENDLDIVRGREAVLERLKSLYKPRLVNVLYSFYCSIQLNGVKDVQMYLSEATYYRNLKYLKEAKIDISQSYKVEEMSFYNFNPFNAKEVA